MPTVYRRMEAKASLVRTDGAVELYAVTVVYLNLSLVIYPRNTEHDHDAPASVRRSRRASLRYSFLVGFNHYADEGFENLFNGLVKFRLGRDSVLLLFQWFHLHKTFSFPPLSC